MRSDNNNNNYCRPYTNKSFCSSYCSTNGLWINKEEKGAYEERATIWLELCPRRVNSCNLESYLLICVRIVVFMEASIGQCQWNYVTVFNIFIIFLLQIIDNLRNQHHGHNKLLMLPYAKLNVNAMFLLHYSWTSIFYTWIMGIFGLSRLLFPGCSFSWISITYVMSTAKFFPSDYVMKLRCKLNLFHFKAQLSMCFAHTHTP